MLLVRQPDNENYIFRHSSETIEMGFFPVIYGMRLRAGYKGSLACNVDWCCGDNDAHLNYLFNILHTWLSSISDESTCFSQIPPFSEIKPAPLDAKFMSSVSRPVKNIVKVPTYSELRALWAHRYNQNKI